MLRRFHRKTSATTSAFSRARECVDFKGFFGALQKIGYEDAVAPEVFGHGIKEMGPQEGAWQGLKFTREAMRNAGLAAVLNYRLA